ncbi:MAG: hypothetical protein JWR54_149 [Mucilaginibacter sp.]|nr:hypothetical protein [Mucilaginibacter sp.]
MAKNLDKWLIAKKKFKLSDKQIQMARELGLNPNKFGSLDNHKQETWKAPLHEFIEHIYFKRFKRETPDQIVSIECKLAEKKKKAKKKFPPKTATAKIHSYD